MTATLPSDVDRLEAHEIPAAYDRGRMRAFVEKTRHAQGAELANAQTVFNLLCEALQVTPPRYPEPRSPKWGDVVVADGAM